MQFEIPEKNLRLFAISLQCLAKLGDQVGFEGREDKLVLRVLNMSHSAFAGLTFARQFFGAFELKIEAGALPSLSGLTCKCQVMLKACCSVFKLSTIQQVEKCVGVIDPLAKKLEFQLHCKRGVRKRYNISFDDEGDSLEARYNPSMPAHIVVHPKMLLDCLSNFHTSALDELTFELPRQPRDGLDGAPPPSVAVRIKSAPSMQPASNIADASLLTELTMDSASFEHYEVPLEALPDGSLSDEPITVTFSMKDFRAIVALCDAVAQPMTIQIARAGQPMVLSTRFLSTFEATFVIATMFDTNSSSSSSAAAAQAQAQAAAAQAARSKDEEQAVKQSPPPTQAQKTTRTRKSKGHANNSNNNKKGTAAADATTTTAATTEADTNMRDNYPDEDNTSDIVPPPLPYEPEPPAAAADTVVVKEAPSQQLAAKRPPEGDAGEGSSPKRRELAGAVVYAPQTSLSREEEGQLRELPTMYTSEEEGRASTAPVPQQEPQFARNMGTAANSSSASRSATQRRESKAPPLLPQGRLYLGDTELSLHPLYPARTQSGTRTASNTGSGSGSRHASQAPPPPPPPHTTQAGAEEVVEPTEYARPRPREEDHTVPSTGPVLMP